MSAVVLICFSKFVALQHQGEHIESLKVSLSAERSSAALILLTVCMCVGLRMHGCASDYRCVHLSSWLQILLQLLREHLLNFQCPGCSSRFHFNFKCFSASYHRSWSKCWSQEERRRSAHLNTDQSNCFEHPSCSKFAWGGNKGGGGGEEHVFTCSAPRLTACFSLLTLNKSLKINRVEQPPYGFWQFMSNMSCFQ